MSIEWKEKELEDWIETNPKHFFDMLMPYQSGSYPMQVELIGRQVPCKTGRIDMLFATWIDRPNSVVMIWVVELKATPVKPIDIEQVLRYAATVESLDWYQFLSSQEFIKFGHHLDSYIQVVPVVVGPSFGKDTGYFEHRVHAKLTDDGFEFSAFPTQPYSTYSNQTILRLLKPAVRRAAESAAVHELMQSMDASAINGRNGNG